MGDNQKCAHCGKAFHWCVTCQEWTADDAAREDGYCCSVCAMAAYPEWMAHDEGEYQ